MWLAVRLGAGRLPEGVSWRHVTGMAAVAGIGFTVSIFVSGLAYDGAALVDQAKIGVLVASALAAVIGSALLLTAPSPATPTPADEEASQQAPH
jgi:NhaA family Na+:H+ antiporter